MSPQPIDKDEAAKKRDKKRELDRRAQRAARARNRNRIANLEATIDLMRNNESGNSITTLVNQLNDVTKERDELRTTLKSIGELIQRGIPSGPSDTIINRDGNRSDENEASAISLHGNLSQGVAGQGSSPRNVLDAMLTDETADPLFGPSPLPSPTLALQGDHTEATQLDREHPPHDSLMPTPPATASPDDIIIPESQFPCDCISPDSPKSAARRGSKSIWREANSILGRSETLVECNLETEDDICEDLPIKAIIGGWDGVESAAASSPLWKKLRQIDQLQFHGCQNVERLAILILMHRVLRYRADPDHNFGAKFPPWLLQRPSQSLPHSSAIDFFVWPGVRERFVFSQHQYCSNSFWKVFTDCFRVAWPFEFRDCYMTNIMTGRYSLSPQFETHIQKITSWTMTLDFFTHFPEMYGDIPSFEEVPRLLHEVRQGEPRQRSEEQEDACYTVYRHTTSDKQNDMLSLLFFN